jgi:hypothetical protein
MASGIVHPFIGQGIPVELSESDTPTLVAAKSLQIVGEPHICPATNPLKETDATKPLLAGLGLVIAGIRGDP